MKYYQHKNFLYPLLTWLKDFIGELGDDLRHEGGVCVGEERNCSHQSSTVKEDHILEQIKLHSVFMNEDPIVSTGVNIRRSHLIIMKLIKDYIMI